MPTIEVTLKVDGTERAALVLPARWVRYALTDWRLGVAKESTMAEKAVALLRALVDRAGVRAAPQSPGDEFGDWVRRRVGRARGLEREVSPTEWQDDGAKAILAELDALPAAEDATGVADA